MALMLALDRRLKTYIRTVDSEHCWKYYMASKPMGLNSSTLGLFGFGKIGRAVARRARGFGMRVLAVDPHADEQQASELGATITDAKTLLRESDVISNHMNLTAENRHFFDDAGFAAMEKHPIFLNVSRGGSVDAEKPDLENCALIGRENVILTPHAAFYSARSIEALQRMSCHNLTDCLTGNRAHAFKIVNGVSI